MSSLTNINNNSYVVNVGRTTPVSPGQQTADKSIPVVVASDQAAIPVVEQNKVVSEVALSLLGIPRSEVALGIFADVNTYDVNPTEWSSEPAEYTLNSNGDGWGIKHLPDEAGALIEAPKDKVAVLTSKRFFRYQPGRVSAATFGVKSTNSPSPTPTVFDRNQSIRKYGIFDKYDGYYWETRGDSTGDNFSVVRRTQSLLRNNALLYGDQNTEQREDHGLSGKAPNVYREPPNAFPSETALLMEQRFKIIETAFQNAQNSTPSVAGLSAELKAKCKRDMDLAMDAYILDLQYGGNAHTIVNATTYQVALLTDRTSEGAVHTALRDAIVAALPVGNAATKIQTLSAILIGVVGVGGSLLSQGAIDAAVYGNRSRISTVFAIYSKYYAYLASEYTVDADLTTVIASTAYTTSSASLSAEEIKYRCYRDVKYVMEGYAQDLEFGGNASTAYNAHRYYFNGIQVYSQTPGGATGEIRRHTFIKKLLTENTSATDIQIPVPTTPNPTVKYIDSMFTLFPDVFAGSTDRINTLTNIIITNFTPNTRFSGAIDYGSGANYGDLVVLRDGLIMTHAAVYDPSLLKPTKNVVAKPGFVVRTTTGATLGTQGSNTISVTSATGIVAGLSVRASVTGIPNGTTVVQVVGTTVTLSANLTAPIANGSNVSFGDSTLEVAEGDFVVGQHINFYGTSAGVNANGLTANKLYRVEKVRGRRGNIITLSDAVVKSKFKATVSGTTLTVTENVDSAVVLTAGMRIEGKGLAEGTTLVSGSGSTVGSTWTINTAPANTQTDIEITKVAIIGADLDPTTPVLIYINPNVPFVFPEEYFVGKGSNPTRLKRPDGMFPLLYVVDGQVLTEATALDESSKVGHINTSIVNSDPVTLRSEIDTVNLIYNNWVKQNVDPRYYSVYEFRVPRSRFSTDQLNGSEFNKTVYSDVATGSDGGKLFPGTPVTADGIALQTKSVWKIDFTKVTMLKVEFSWYGAVGALFLAYVPVSNGEARWVRVHHLRASNQLKISSLGNATLPITYLVYGGGSVSRLGITDDTNKGYTNSNHVVKYGASYYIDGGDRGTVRLYSHSSLDPASVYGSRYSLGSLTLQPVDGTGLRHFDVTGVNNLPADKKFFMKAKLITGNRADQNVEIVWVEGNKLYINKGTLNSQTNLFLIANRPSVVFGLKAKENILNAVGIGVRNRVQVYPTKLSTSNIAPVGVTTSPKVKMQLMKTPIYQPAIVPTGTFTLSSEYIITPTNEALPNSSNYLTDGQGIYGWFIANVGTVFGYLYRQGSSYYFTLLETYSEEVILKSGASFPFLADGRFTFDGASLALPSEDTVQKERLSSVFVSTQIQCPVPKTGIEVASFFLQEGADMFDLLNYFDYNKDYLSFPLTNKVESIYLVASSVQTSTGATAVAEISSSLTWEEQ